MCESDADLRRHVETYRRSGSRIPPAGLIGGDLWRTLGAPGGGAGRLFGQDALTVPIDVASVLLDGRQFWFCGHLAARRRWLYGRVVIAMNAEWLGRYDLGPKSHPNDGRLDVYDTTMAPSERLKARRRARTGAHVPHPDIVYRRVRAHQMTFDPPLDVWLDGDKIGRFTNVTIKVEPDAMVITV